MTSDRWGRIEALYHEMLARPVHERPAALNAACAGDTALQAEVQSLLDPPTSAARLLATPALEVAARLVSPASARLTGRRIGVFEVHGLLGVGGMGEVYRARDTRLGRDVAIKVLPATFTADPEPARAIRARGARARLAQPPEHRRDLRLERTAGITALVMEFVDGQTLDERSRAGADPGREARHIARADSRRAGGRAREGIVHRDLKPANIKMRPMAW